MGFSLLWFLLWFYPPPSSPIFNSHSLESPPPFPFSWLHHLCWSSPPSHSLAIVPLHCPGFGSYFRIYILLMRGHVSSVFLGLGYHSMWYFTVPYIDLQKNPSHSFGTRTPAWGALLCALRTRQMSHWPTTNTKAPAASSSGTGPSDSAPPGTLFPPSIPSLFPSVLPSSFVSRLPFSPFVSLYLLLSSCPEVNHCSPRWSGLTFAVPQWSPLAMD